MIEIIICALIAQITVSPLDIELQYIADPTSQWRSVDIVSIEYSPDPVGVHISKGRLGLQKWEFLLQADEPELGKCIVTFNLLSLPAPTFRGHIIRTRVRDDVDISVWEVSDSIRIFGKPGKAVYRGGQ